MHKAVIRWIFVFGVLFGVGPLASNLLLGGLRDVEGGHAASLLVCASPTSGLVRGVLMIAVAGVVGVVGTMAFGRDTGVLTTGLTFVWAAWHVGTTEEMVRVAGGAGPLKILALEGLLVSALGVMVGYVVQMIGKKDPGEGALLAARDEATNVVPTLGTIVVAAVIACGLASWVVAAAPLKGQAVFAAICGGIAAGGAAHIVGTLHAARPNFTAVLIAFVIVAGVGPIAAQVMGGAHVLIDAQAGKLFALARPISFDWLAGAFLGVPIGISWAASMLDRQAHPAASSAAPGM